VTELSDSLAPVLDFLRRHAPFDQMAPAHLDYLAKRLKLVFYAQGESVIGPDDGPADRFFIVKQGVIRGTCDNGDSAWELITGESFPIGALLSRRPVRTHNRAEQDTFCFELDRDTFDYLLARSEVFHDFCTRRLASLLDGALRAAQAYSANQVTSDNSFNTPLSSLIRRPPISCSPTTSIHDVLQQMAQAHIGSMVITDTAQRPIGVFTLHDVLSRVALPAIDLTHPISRVMTPDPLTLAPEAMAYEAALLMAQAGFGHICVSRDNQLVGVVSERDLFSLQRVGLVSLSRRITAARSVDALAAMEEDVHRLIEQMLAQGASVDQLTQIITTLNDHLTRRVIDLRLAGAELPCPFTWLSFGSEGRHEQTLKTDQDNGILFQPPAGSSADEVRAALLPLAQQINDDLARCGFPLCPGNIMASNPACCLSYAEWQQQFRQWIDQGTPEHLLKATIFFDFRPLWGESEPAERLRHWLAQQAQPNSRFRRQLAANALRNRPPLGWLRDFTVARGGEHANTLDLKVNGLALFVDAARLLALAVGSSATSTAARLHDATAQGALKAADRDAYLEACHFIQLLRMRNHRRQAEAGEPLSNHIDPDRLNELDRRVLKEAFRQARKLQSKLTLEYQL